MRAWGVAMADQLWIEFTRGRLGKYKYPREARIVDSVPLTPVGKISRTG